MGFIMPLKENKYGKQDKASVNYKARLEKKLYLAQESPEPVFDISDCNLKIIPSNVFALCKVLRKEALYLQNNNLTSLSSSGSLRDLKFLKVINLNSNKFTRLPDSINELENLEVLEVSNNKLVDLPETIGCLKNLVYLNLSQNNLKLLPNSIGNCKNMEVLIITKNENLRHLPTTLATLHSLKQLEIDSTVTYPPKEVCTKGVYEVLKFLAKELKEDVEIPSTSSGVRRSLPNFDNLQEKLELLEKLKQEKQNERLLFEKQLLDQNQKELEVHKKLKDNKMKLLEDLKNQQQSLDAELIKVQEQRNVDRAVLIQLFQDEETHSNEVVSKILNIKRNLNLQYSNEWENERKAEEMMLLSQTAQSRALERKKILLSMEELMREEILKAQNIRNDRRLLFTQSLTSEVSQQNDTLQNLLKKRYEDQAQLIDTLRQDEELQRSAVAYLLEKSDAAFWELSKQISIIEDQLVELTRLEMSKRQLESECQLSKLSKSRIALTELLMNLLDRQKERREHLIDTIRKMETLKESVKDSETFWMEQYDKLLNSKAHEMVKFLEAVNPKLVYELYINGAFHFLPLLKDIVLSESELQNLNESSLIELGVKNIEDRKNIIRGISSFLEYPSSRQIIPTAPLLEEASAPSVDNSDLKQVPFVSYLVPEECVICLESKPNVIFVPCGHICCCHKCFKSITLCPLCRKPINAGHRKVE